MGIKIADLPTADPEVLGVLWRDGDGIMVSAGIILEKYQSYGNFAAIFEEVGYGYIVYSIEHGWVFTPGGTRKYFKAINPSSNYHLIWLDDQVHFGTSWGILLLAGPWETWQAFGGVDELTPPTMILYQNYVVIDEYIPDVTRHMVAYLVDNPTSGTITGDVVQLVVDGEDATEVIFVLNPDPDYTYRWDKWNDDVLTQSRTDVNVAAQILVGAVAIKTWQVTFDLGSHLTRTGGGTLVQTIDEGLGATAPTFDVETGWQFDGWDTDFSAIGADMTVTALVSEV